MSIFSKIKTQIVGRAHDAVDAAEDVGVTARQTVRELDNDIAKVEEALVGVNTQYNLLTSQRDAAQADVEKYAGYAQKAVGRGDDALAREALSDKAKATQALQAAQKIVDDFKPNVERLEQRIAQLREQRDAAERGTDLLQARSEIAKAESRAATVLSGIGSAESTAKTLDRLNGKVARQEAEAHARMDMADAKSAADPSKKYASLDATPVTAIDDELAALKAAAGK